MSDRELNAEIVKSGMWLYDKLVPSEVWIVRQNFEYHYEEDYSDAPEGLNQDGEQFQVVLARNSEKIGLGPSGLSLTETIAAAEKIIPTEVQWTDHILGRLYGGRRYLVTPE
jgi:hypothetical protein